MPDIDLDFQDDLRSRMLEYCTQKYGSDKVAQIITFGTMGTKAALRDVGRVMDIPLNEVDRVAKLVPFVPGHATTMQDALALPEFKEAYDSQPHLRELIDVAAKMEGTVRNAGTHAAGVVISDKPIMDYLPLHRPTSGSEETPIKTVTQFEMGMLDSLGMLKVDILGLITLTVMQRACEMIEKRHGVKLHLNNIPLDDPKAFELLGQRTDSRRLPGGRRRNDPLPGPDEADQARPHHCHGGALPPGPDALHPRLHRPHAREGGRGIPSSCHGADLRLHLRHPRVSGTADACRRGTGRVLAFRVGRAAQRDLQEEEAGDREAPPQIRRRCRQAWAWPRNIAEGIFADWEEFARYGFNKSHAADYGVIAVQTAYLKAQLSCRVPGGTSLGVCRSDREGRALCRRRPQPGRARAAPDINASGWDFDIEDADDRPSIRFGLGAIKNLGHTAMEQVLSERHEHGRFKDLNDFARRVDLRAVGKRGLECLIKVGALDAFGDRIAMLASLERITAISSNHFRARESGPAEPVWHGHGRRGDV